MAKITASLLPATADALRRLGERLKLARLRRRLTARQLAERAGMAPMTLRGIERGSAGVTIGAYLSVMQVLGLAEDINRLAATDAVGRELQDAGLPSRVRAPRRPPSPSMPPQPIQGRRASRIQPAGTLAGFTSAADLVASLHSPEPPRRANASRDVGRKKG